MKNNDLTPLVGPISTRPLPIPNRGRGRPSVTDSRFAFLAPLQVGEMVPLNVTTCDGRECQRLRSAAQNFAKRRGWKVATRIYHEDGETYLGFWRTA